MVLEFPDAVFDLSSEERARAVKRTGRLLEVQGLGAFVQLRIPLALSDGLAMTYEAWLAVDAAGYAKARAGVGIHGSLASQFPPWSREILGKPAQATADAQGRYRLVAGEDAFLTKLVSEEWPHALILTCLPDALR